MHDRSRMRSFIKSFKCDWVSRVSADETCSSQLFTFQVYQATFETSETEIVPVFQVLYSFVCLSRRPS